MFKKKVRRMDIKFLITCINDEIDLAKRLVKLLPKNSKKIISHQIYGTNKEYDVKFDDDNVTYLKMFTKGLSKNRNNLLNHVFSGIGIITDCDVLPVDHILENIQEAFEKFPDADVITFQRLDLEANLNRKYSKAPFKHNKLTILKVSSIQIAFKIESIKKKKIAFDENFGAGTDLPIGEENLFLNEALKKKLKVMYYPRPLFKHELRGSGSKYSDKIIKARVLLLNRIFGRLLSPIFIIYFSIFHYKLYRGQFSFFDFLRKAFYYYVDDLINGEKSGNKNP